VVQKEVVIGHALNEYIRIKEHMMQRDIITINEELCNGYDCS